MWIPNAPNVKTVRVVKINDAALPTERKIGVNAQDYDELAVVVTLKNSASAAVVEPHFWSDAAGAFLPAETPIIVAVSVRRVIRVARSVSVFFEVTGIIGGLVTSDRVFIEASGLPNYGQVG